VRFVNAAIVLLALLATLGGYFQEKKRLGEIQAMPPAAARDAYEKAQARRDRMMVLVTTALVAGAIAALIAFKVQR
jgi:hypothetical protein